MSEKKHHKAFDVVQAGYNALGNLYTSEREKADNWREIETFASRLPAKGRVLDAGSGTGIPIARYLVQSGFDVVGIDFSKTMVGVASRNVPGATFKEMNMTEIDFPPESFDGVISTYAIIHVPRELHAGIFRLFYSVLRPRGALLVSVASWAWEEYAQYMGVDMFWSHFDPDKSQALVTDAGFEIEFARDVETGGEKHHWILALKK